MMTTSVKVEKSWSSPAATGSSASATSTSTSAATTTNNMTFRGRDRIMHMSRYFICSDERPMTFICTKAFAAFLMAFYLFFSSKSPTFHVPQICQNGLQVPSYLNNGKRLIKSVSSTSDVGLDYSSEVLDMSYR